LKALGSDPNDIKYVLISHAHSDHVGGASYLQDRFNAKVIMSEADWNLLDTTKASWRKPRRELVATDGQKLTLGETTLVLNITPGHTLGTISTLIPRAGQWHPSRRSLLGRHGVQLGGEPRHYITQSARTASGSTITFNRRSASGRWRAMPAPM
jgi:metallo-beta-lactamase class B